MRILYNSFIFLFHFSATIISLFNSKVKLFVDGNKTTIKQLREKKDFGLPIWFHCASLGEFEQARPLIEKIKEKIPHQKILLTFFSPSGYEFRKNYSFADYVMYLPPDSPTKARLFLATVKPKMAVFVKYEFWYNYLNELQLKHIPHYFICALFREDQYFFKTYASWAQQHLRKVTHFFVQDLQSKNLLQSIGVEHVSIAGDTRFDRVSSIALQAKQIKEVESFKGNELLLVAGSTWSKDEVILTEFYKHFLSSKISKRLKLLIAPHHISENRISEIEKRFAFVKSIRHSKLIQDNEVDYDVLIIDNIGMLSSLYSYADFSYIGGGFGAAVHNTLEAAVYGMPIYFGPNHYKFKEIQELMRLKCAHEINDAVELSKSINSYISDSYTYQRSCNAASSYIKTNKGAIDTILQQLTIN